MRKCGFVSFAVVGVFLSTVDIMNVWRTSVFLVTQGQRVTREGYLEAKKAFDAYDVEADLSGITFLITGANSGIGKSTAFALANRGGEVHMICRNRTRCEKTKLHIASVTKNSGVLSHILDMSDIESVHRFAEEFTMRYRKLDVLVNNAAVMVHRRTLTPEDLELSFATNTMGYYTLTTAFLPLLKNSGRSRVVMVSSGGLLMASLRVLDLQYENCTFYGAVAYNEQKRHQLVMAEELAKLHEDIQFSVMNPGWVDTPGLRKSIPDFYNRYKYKFRTPDEGADTVVWLAASGTALLHDSGLFYMDRKPVSTHLLFAFTNESGSDRSKLMKALDEISERLKPDDVPHQFFGDD